MHKNENVWPPQKRIFTSKARLNSEVYDQAGKLTPEAEKKNLTTRTRLYQFVHTIQLFYFKLKYTYRMDARS